MSLPGDGQALLYQSSQQADRRVSSWSHIQGEHHETGRVLPLRRGADFPSNPTPPTPITAVTVRYAARPPAAADTRSTSWDAPKPSRSPVTRTFPNTGRHGTTGAPTRKAGSARQSAISARNADRRSGCMLRTGRTLSIRFASAIDTPLPKPPETTHLMLAHKAPWVTINLADHDVRFEQYPDTGIESWHKQRGLVRRHLMPVILPQSSCHTNVRSGMA